MPNSSDPERRPIERIVPARPIPCAIAFDLGGVVFRYVPERRLTGLARATGRPEPVLQKALIDSGYSRSCDAGGLSAEAAYREGVRLIGQRMSFASFRAHWISAFEPDPAVVDLVRRVRRRLPVAMLTNNSDLVRSGLDDRYPEVMELFRPRVFSADTGVLKPDPRAFRTLLDLLGMQAREVMYVDGEPASVAAAASLGIVSRHFRSAVELEDRLRGDRIIE